MINRGILGLFLAAIVFNSCKEDVIPKPKALLRLEYPRANTAGLDANHFQFEYNEMAKLKSQNNNSLELNYPFMKGAIFINYKKVDGNLKKLISDAQRLSFEHAVKADNIEPKLFVNDKEKVYGMFSRVIGDAASQAQFYVTDSTKHFVTGSLYFYVKPNYDSIYPAAEYLQNDMRWIMETLKWKN